MSEALIKIGLIIILMTAFAAAFWFQGDAHGAVRVTAAQDAVRAEKQIQADKIDSAAQKAIGELNAKNRDLEKRLQNEVKKHDIYQSCIVPDDGVQLYNENAKISP